MDVPDLQPALDLPFPAALVGGAGGSDRSDAQRSAQTVAALLQAQMDSLLSSATLGGIGQGGGLLGGGGGGGFGGLLGGGLLGGGGGGGFGGLLGGGLGGGGLGGGGLQNLLLMQTLQPLTEAINRLVERLDGAAETPDIETMPTPASLPHRDLLERLAEAYSVPAAFLGAVMMAESGGDPRAVGDEGASVGLFQLHERGMGAGLGDLRFDPELNAAVGARGLAVGWHEGLRHDLRGEELVRFAYDYRFNPGGGPGWQGDAVYSHYRFYEALARRSAAT